MRFHDYHLDGYHISDGGQTITLDLLYDYEGHPKDRSLIRFKDVDLYYFIHSSKAIILDISEIPIERVCSDYATDITEWNRLSAVKGFSKGMSDYQTYLTSKGSRAWYIYSAIGFSGFVIARTVEQIAEQDAAANP